MSTVKETCPANVGTEHVLLACHADADWPAAQLLTRLGATEERLRAEILRVLKQG